MLGCRHRFSERVQNGSCGIKCIDLTTETIKVLYIFTFSYNQKLKTQKKSCKESLICRMF